MAFWLSRQAARLQVLLKLRWGGWGLNQREMARTTLMPPACCLRGAGRNLEPCAGGAPHTLRVPALDWLPDTTTHVACIVRQALFSFAHANLSKKKCFEYCSSWLGLVQGQESGARDFQSPCWEGRTRATPSRAAGKAGYPRAVGHGGPLGLCRSAPAPAHPAALHTRACPAGIPLPMHAHPRVPPGAHPLRKSPSLHPPGWEAREHLTKFSHCVMPIAASTSRGGHDTRRLTGELRPGPVMAGWGPRGAQGWPGQRAAQFPPGHPRPFALRGQGPAPVRPWTRTGGEGDIHGRGAVTDTA